LDHTEDVDDDDDEEEDDESHEEHTPKMSIYDRDELMEK
jgi:hypothetical protein